MPRTPTLRSLAGRLRPARPTPLAREVTPTELTVNGETVTVHPRGLESLASVLREQLGLTGTKVACGRGECGACTVLVGGVPRMSCTMPAALVREPVDTIEGLAAETADLRAEFADAGAFQCGFCTPGQVVHACALLRDGSAADRQHVAHALSGNICRCTGYQAITDAVCRVAERRTGAAGSVPGSESPLAQTVPPPHSAPAACAVPERSVPPTVPPPHRPSDERGNGAGA